MKTNIGLWIDHRKAVIVFESEAGEVVKGIASNADKQPGRLNGERSHERFESSHVPADDVRDRRYVQHLNSYYDKVIESVHEATSLLILGPGEAKGELAKRLEQWKTSGRIMKIETADKMTDRQIVAKVREHFKGNSPAIVM